MWHNSRTTFDGEQQMTATIKPLHPIIGGEVSDIDLCEPLSAEDVAILEKGMDKYAVLVFRGQNITDAQQAAFSRNFGELELPGSISNITKEEDRRLGPEMADVSNLNKGNKPFGRDDRARMFNLGNRLWHSDSSYKAVPAKYSLLSGRIVTEEGGETQFADMRAAYDALDYKTKALIEDMVCEHSLLHSRGSLGFDDLTEEETRNFTPVRQSLTRTHPVSKRKSIYLSAHIGQILSLPRPEAMCLIRDLAEAATQREFVYSHKWQQYDLVIWDNRQTMHRVTAFNDVDEIRDMRRTTVAGDAPTAAQVAD
jgi:alpha-ketoglutarate-dependent 2,4-dichlorophenoxyacetate dioxygenase